MHQYKCEEAVLAPGKAVFKAKSDKKKKEGYRIRIEGQMCQKYITFLYICTVKIRASRCMHQKLIERMKRICL